MAASLDGQVQAMRDACDLEFYNSLQVLQSFRQVFLGFDNWRLSTSNTPRSTVRPAALHLRLSDFPYPTCGHPENALEAAALRM